MSGKRDGAELTLRPRSGRPPTDGSAVVLQHRLTGEEVLLDSAFCKRYLLRMLSGSKFTFELFGGELHLTFDEQPVAKVTEILGISILQDKKGRWQKSICNGSTPISRSDWVLSLQYMILSCGSKHSWKVWQVSSYSLGAQHWVSLNDMRAYEPIFDSEFPSSGMSC